MILDAFAGPGGWSEGLRSIGLSDVGLEWDRWACATRAAAGHLTVRCDVAAYPVAPFVGRVRGLIASPPCQAFSMAGKREGIKDLGLIHAAVEAARAGWRDDLRDGDWADPRSALILEPLRWAWSLRPEWIACEQVPPCLPVWEHMADVLRSWGYDARAVKLNAADYGVPQTRVRAFLLAHRERVRVPEPTHARSPVPSLFGELAPWVSMAEALGWTEGWRAMDRRVGGFAADIGVVTDDRPAPTLCLSGGREVWLQVGASANATSRPAPAPAPALFFGHQSGNVKWVTERPATTVQGRDVLGGPGHRDMGPDGPHFQDSPNAVRITVEEAAVLQSFPADYPFQGPKTARFRQVGDACPPRMMAHVLGALIGVPNYEIMVSGRW